MCLEEKKMLKRPLFTLGHHKQQVTSQKICISSFGFLPVTLTSVHRSQHNFYVLMV